MPARPATRPSPDLALHARTSTFKVCSPDGTVLCMYCTLTWKGLLKILRILRTYLFLPSSGPSPVLSTW